MTLHAQRDRNQRDSTGQVKELSLNHLRDLVHFSFETYEHSRAEAERTLNYYHNRQYIESELESLKSRGQPAETFNVIKLFARLLIGYYSTIVNSIIISPRQHNDIENAAILNDLVKHVFEVNQLETEGDKIKLDGLLTGLMCSFIDVIDTGEKDDFGRPILQVAISHVPSTEILLDPASTLEDYSDARFIHRYKWMTEEDLIKLFPKKRKQILQLAEYDNWTTVDEAEFEDTFNVRFTGSYREQNFYLLVHTIITDSKDKTWSIFWHDELEFERTEVTFKEVKFPYRVQKIQYSNIAEYYGLFREVLESQRSINQAILKLQLMANTQKIFVQKDAVKDIATFKEAVNRVNAIIPVEKLSGILVENQTAQTSDQYVIIDKGFERIKQVLGITDSFLGQAFASDSGRKVKLQLNQTSLALRHISVRIEQYYRLLGWDTVNLIKQYYTATQVFRIADEIVGERWLAINQPLTQWSGQFDETGEPIMEIVWEEVIDPATDEPLVDDEGNLVIAPVATGETEIEFTDVDISIDSVAFNDQDEKAQLMLETMIQGTIGQSISAVNPVGFYQLSALAVKGIKSKYTANIVAILEDTAKLIQQGSISPREDAPGIKSPKSSTLKLPQNTNEGI